MKKNLIALAVLAASGAAFAQSNVTVYGIADVWFGAQKDVATGLTQTRVNSGGVSGSRFGFKGSEDLGGGLKANFLLEQGFAIDSGAADASGPTVSGAAAGTQMFARQSYAGFSGSFGEVKLGKPFTAYDDISGATNPAWDSALSPQNNVWLSGGYAYNPGNTVYYASPTVAGFSGALSYSFGENKTAAVDAGAVISVHVKYEGGPLYAGLAYQTEKATDAVAANEFTRVNASYDLGVAKLLAGYGRVAGAAGAEVNEWQIGADFPVSKVLTLSGGIARSSDNAAAGDFSREGYSLAASYTMSKRTSLYGGYQASTKKKSGVADADGSLLAFGVRHAF